MYNTSQDTCNILTLCIFLYSLPTRKSISKVVLSSQATAVYDAEHAESIQKGQHIQPSANGFLLAPGNKALIFKFCFTITGILFRQHFTKSALPALGVGGDW